MPKAKPYPDSDDKDEEERTTIESGWEDEASTTVEQGEVADKVQRALNKQNGHLPQQQHNTGTGTGVDEPTVDDQHAPVLSAITPIRPDNVARLLIEQGNDAGQEIEIRPGKSYTIGRGLDNDIVLTDIAVSRKHFDLKFDDGAWIIVDRGSGNGTVVNGNVEDNPFMLASGDLIEIGNTVFKYDQPNGAPRPSQLTYDIDDEEMSTVAGKPLRGEVVDVPPPAQQRFARPKTMPPPLPLPSSMRSTHTSSPPPLSPQYPVPPPLQPASTLPMPQMANRPPLGMPTMLGDSMGMPLAMHSIPIGANGGPTTIPGQGPQPRPSYPYPTTSDIPPHSVHAQMLLIQTQNRRGDGSTAHVPPAPYDPQWGVQQQHHNYAAPQLSKRTKLAIAGIGLALLTGIVTAAVVKSSTSKPKAAATSKQGKAGKGDTKVVAKQLPSKPTVEPITPAPVQPTNTTDTKAVQPTTPAKVEPKVESKVEPKVEPKVEAKTEPKVEAKTEPKIEPKVEPKVQPKVEPKREPKVVRTRVEPRREPKREPKVEPKREPSRVAVASDSSAARDKADRLYRERKFNDASNVLASASKSADDDEADELRDRSTKYTLLGKALAQGTAPAQKATLAFNSLTQALNLDANLGGNFRSEINGKLATIAPKAAVAFIAQTPKDYLKARSALLKAQELGSTDGNLGLVKQKLESHAGELYGLASAEASSNPGPAKEKLKQIRQLVDAKSPWAVKAQALYNKL